MKIKNIHKSSYFYIEKLCIMKSKLVHKQKGMSTITYYHPLLSALSFAFNVSDCSWQIIGPRIDIEE